jgi:AcrR family transcriptional regulator
MYVQRQVGGKVASRAVVRFRRPDLERDEIVAAALAIVDRDGVDALSMRALATELNAATMAAYNHVKDKDELLSLVCDAALAQIPLPDLSVHDWEERLRTYATVTWRSLTKRPWLGELLLRHGAMNRSAQVESYELLMITFRDAGFDPPGARSAVGAFMAFMVGSQLLPGQRPRAGGARSGRSRRAQEHFAFGLNTLIDGLRCQLNPQPWVRGQRRIHHNGKETQRA